MSWLGLAVIRPGAWGLPTRSVISGYLMASFITRSMAATTAAANEAAADTTAITVSTRERFEAFFLATGLSHLSVPQSMTNTPSGWRATLKGDCWVFSGYGPPTEAHA